MRTWCLSSCSSDNDTTCVSTQAASQPPAVPDPDIKALVRAKLLADGEIVQYRVPGGQAADPASPTAAPAAEAPTSGSLGGSSGSGGAPTTRGKGHDPVLASAAVSDHANWVQCCDARSGFAQQLQCHQ
jgi:hypothetical protein